MKRLVKHAIITCAICCINFFSFCQSTNGTGANGYVVNRYLGWDASNSTNPLYFKTNNAFRMKLNATVSYPRLRWICNPASFTQHYDFTFFQEYVFNLCGFCA